MFGSHRKRRKKLGHLESLEARNLFAGVVDSARDFAIADPVGTDVRVLVADLPRDDGFDPSRDFVGNGGDPTEVPSLEEVDVIHIGGSPHVGAGAYLVTAVGTGGNANLTSWRLTGSNTAPIELEHSRLIKGHNLKLHTLSPALSPKLQAEPFLLGHVGNNGNLWLRSNSVNAAGSITEHIALGYGSNVGVDVVDFAIAHQPRASNSNTVRVVTPVVTKSPSDEIGLRMLSWDVNVNTGAISGLHDTGDLDLHDVPESGSQISIAHQDGNHYAVSYLTAYGQLVNRNYFVWSGGAISVSGGEQSGFDLRMEDKVYTAGDDVIAIGLESTGVVTATIDDGDVKISVWDKQVGEGDADGLWEPSLIADNTLDKAPHKKGVLIDQSDLSDVSQRLGSEESQFFGFAVATGDFNKDGFEDAVIGAPNKDSDDIQNTGNVRVIYGSADGLSHNDESFSQASDVVQGIPEAHDNFGYSLAAGDFNGDGWDDLAVGVRGESIEAEGAYRAGAVNILYGSNSGLNDGPNGFVNILRQGNGVQGVAEDFDRFGWSLTTGDFNDDGRDDLAVGAPYEDVGNVENAGAVHIIHGSAFTGMNLNTDLIFTQDDFGFAVEEDDYFGMSLAAGNFDGKSGDDLAIGTPGESIGAVEDAGGTMILYDTIFGFGAIHDFVSQNGFQNSGAVVNDTPDEKDEFGSTLAAGDFDGDGRVDLAVGAPGEDDGDGQVHVFFGTDDGLGSADQQSWSDSLPSIPYMGGEGFGSTLTTGDFDNDNKADLVVGVPSYDADGKTNAGGVAVIRQVDQGVFSSSVEFIHQSSDGAPSGAESGDWYGGSLAAGDFNDDGNDDLLVGSPYEDDGDTKTSGYVNALYGRIGNDLADTGNDGFGNGTVWGTRALLTDVTEESDGIGNGKLYSESPAGEATKVHAASVTKNMTLLLAVEAIEAGEVSLFDPVEISGLAAGTGGSNVEDPDDPDSPLFQEGDVVSLRDLLYGMMLRSGNKASVAIGEHISGDADDFVTAMNERAVDLDMHDSTFGHPAGGWVTTTQDMTTLWMEARQHLLFNTISNANAHTGTVERDGESIDFPIAKFGTGGAYPGLEGWKGGNGGLWLSGSNPSGAWCTSCLTAQATRLDRPLTVSIQQSGDRWDDAKQLFDFGFESLFTPDNRGHNTYPKPDITDVAVQPRMGTVYDFAADSISDAFVVTAAIDNHDKLLLQTWSVMADSGAVYLSDETLSTVDYLPAGHLDIPADQIDFAELNGVGDQIADYVSVHLDDGKIRLDLWRLGANRLESNGDLDRDGILGSNDIAIVQREVTRNSRDQQFDLNLDGIVDFDDVRHLVEDLLKTKMGDANLDGKVDSRDLNVVGKNWQQPVRGWSDGDFDGNGVVDADDLNLLGSNWQSDTSSRTVEPKRPSKAPLSAESNTEDYQADAGGDVSDSDTAINTQQPVAGPRRANPLYQRADSRRRSQVSTAHEEIVDSIFGSLLLGDKIETLL